METIPDWENGMAHHSVASVFGASSGLTHEPHFIGVSLSKPGKLDPYAGNALGKLGELGKSG